MVLKPFLDKAPQLLYAPRLSHDLCDCPVLRAPKQLLEMVVLGLQYCLA